MRRYYLHTRKNIYYVELVTPEGHKLTARSTGKTTEDEALLVVSRWLADGFPSSKGGKARPIETAIGLSEILKAIRKTDLDGNDAMKIVNALKERSLIDVSIVKAGKGSILFNDFLKQFWNYEESPYIREKKAHGHNIGRRHCRESLNRVQLYYGYFKEQPLNSISRQDLKNFSLSLAESGLAPSSVNKILIVGTTAIKWAFREKMIPENITEGLIRFSGGTKKRGVLSPAEAELIFKVQWKDKRSYAGNLLSLTTGLRAGEVLALRKSDIEEKILNIRHSWCNIDGLKSPKNNEERKVPLLQEVRGKLIELLNENPHKIEDPFIFYGLLPDKPMDQKFLIDGLKAACKEAGIDAKARNIVFHSHRHFYAARMADKMTADEVSRITGHKSRAVFDEYANHIEAENLEKMAAAAAESFGKILQFPKVV